MYKTLRQKPVPCFLNSAPVHAHSTAATLSAPYARCPVFFEPVFPQPACLLTPGSSFVVATMNAADHKKMFFPSTANRTYPPVIMYGHIFR